MVFLLFLLFQVMALLFSRCQNPKPRKQPYTFPPPPFLEIYPTYTKYWCARLFIKACFRIKVRNNPSIHLYQLIMGHPWSVEIMFSHSVSLISPISLCSQVWETLFSMFITDVTVKCLRKLSVYWKNFKHLMVNEKANNWVGHLCYILCNKGECSNTSYTFINIYG